MSVAFNIPSTTSTGQSNVLLGDEKTKLNAGIFTNDDLEKDAIQQQLKYMFPPKSGAAKYKALDLSSNYGAGVSNPLKKFHQVTMYFHNYEISDTSDDETNNKKDTGVSYIITSNLPDNFQYKVGGQWNKPLDWTADSTVDLIVRSATNEKKSLLTMASTGLMWTAPDPLELTFTIHAFDDTPSNSNTNILECLNVLGEYALPDEGQNIYKNVPAGIDLGLTIKTKNNKEYHIGKAVDSKGNTATTDQHSTQAKNLDILIGGMLYVQRMSIKNFTVNYTNTKNMLLHSWGISNFVGSRRLLPMTADITLTLTTVRGLSRLNYSKMLMLHNKDANVAENQSADDSILGTIDLPLNIKD